FVQLWTHIGGIWNTPMRYNYTAWNGCALIASPTPGSTLPGSTVTFTWSHGTGATAYWLDVGTVPAQGNVFAGNLGLATSQTVSGIPTGSVPIYVQLWSLIGGTWYRTTYTYVSR